MEEFDIQRPNSDGCDSDDRLSDSPKGHRWGNIEEEESENIFGTSFDQSDAEISMLTEQSCLIETDVLNPVSR